MEQSNTTTFRAGREFRREAEKDKKTQFPPSSLLEDGTGLLLQCYCCNFYTVTVQLLLALQIKFRREAEKDKKTQFSPSSLLEDGTGG